MNRSNTVKKTNKRTHSEDLTAEQGKHASYTLVTFSGRRIPAEVFDGGTIFSTKTRLRSGINRFDIFFFLIQISDFQNEEHNRKCVCEMGRD